MQGDNFDSARLESRGPQQIPSLDLVSWGIGRAQGLRRPMPHTACKALPDVFSSFAQLVKIILLARL